MSARSSFRVSFVVSLALGASVLGPGCRAVEAPLPAQTVAVSPPPVSDAAPAAVADAPPVLGTYEAPPGRAGELANLLQQVLRRGKDNAPLGKATAVDEDRVLLVAPRSIHDGVAQLCEQMKQVPVAPARSVRIDYWLVKVTDSDVNDTSAVPEIADALAEVSANRGPAEFTVVERASLSSMLNARASTRGATAEFSQVASAHEGSVVADLDVDLDRAAGLVGELRTRVVVGPSQTMVIGLNGFEQVRGANTDQVSDLVYVVRAELVDAV